MSAPTRLSRLVRLAAVVAAALLAGVAVTFLPLGIGPILGAVAGMAVAAFAGSRHEPGPDTPDGSTYSYCTYSDDGDGGDD